MITISRCVKCNKALFSYSHDLCRDCFRGSKKNRDWIKLGEESNEMMKELGSKAEVVKILHEKHDIPVSVLMAKLPKAISGRKLSDFINDLADELESKGFMDCTARGMTLYEIRRLRIITEAKLVSFYNQRTSGEIVSLGGIAGRSKKYLVVQGHEEEAMQHIRDNYNPYGDLREKFGLRRAFQVDKLNPTMAELKEGLK